jgi:hypothetical protein
MLPLTLGTDEGNRKRRHFHFIENVQRITCAQQIKSKLNLK